MNTEMRELSFDEINQVSGGGTCNPVPGGEGCSGSTGWTMFFGNTMIHIEKDGSIGTTTTTKPQPQ